MRKLLILLASLLLVGCDFTVPLVTTPAIEIDKSILGLWEIKDNDGKIGQLTVLALDKNEYLVSYPSASKDGMFAKACLCRADNRTLIQITWIGNANGKPMDDNRIYQFLSYTVSGDKLTIRLLNNEVVNKDAASSQDLAKSIAANHDNPALFREAGVFTKVAQ